MGHLFSLGLLLGSACSTSTTPTVVISEVMSNNGGSHLDEDGDAADWIELHNTGDSPASLQGWGITDDSGNPYKWSLPYVVIAPGEQLILYASDKDRRNPSQPLHTNFRIKATGEVLMLTSPEAVVVDRVELPPTSADISWGRDTQDPSSWVYFHRPTPGQTNSPDGWTHPLTGTSDSPPLRISEFLVSDGRSRVDEDGDTSDWIELHNRSEHAIDLVGYALSDNAARPEKWHFPDVSLDPDAHLLIYASGKDRRPTSGQPLHTNFRLDGDKDVLVLTDPHGRAIDAVTTVNARPGVSTGRPTADPGLWLSYPTPTPGMANTTRGFDPSLTHTQVHPIDLQINEVVAQHARSSVGDRPDWVEITNLSASVVQLGGVGLSDDHTDPFKWRLPPGELAPGAFEVFDLMGEACQADPCTGHQAPLSIHPRGERLTLTHPSGRIMDVFHTGRLQPGISSGRRQDTGPQRLFFTRPSRGAANSGPAFVGYADPPAFMTPGGPGPYATTVELAPPPAGTVIRVTTNGGEPNSGSRIYTGAIALSGSETIRARAFRADRLPSPTVTRTFLGGKQHPLVMMALTVKDRYMFEETEGLYMDGPGASSEYPHKGANYWSGKELAAHLELYEPGGQLGLDMPVGLKIFGAYSRGLPKKSLQLVAREVYGQGRILYPLFDDKTLTDVHRIVLRQSGQDAFKSHFRDVLMSSLISESGVDYQAHRLAVLYINSKYWGLYNIREKIHPDFLADNHDISQDSVDLLVGNGKPQQGSAEDYENLVHVAKTRGFTDEETYAWVSTQMDLENFADYQIFQMFFANTDNGNIRFWRSRELDGRWRWILYDLDTGFAHAAHPTLDHLIHRQGTGAKRRFSTHLIRALLETESFRDLFLKRASHHLSTTFATSRTLQRIDALAAAIAPEVEADRARWMLPKGKWRREVEEIRAFAQARPDVVRAQLISTFELSPSQVQAYGLSAPEALP